MLFFRNRKTTIEKVQEVVQETNQKVDAHKIVRTEALEEAKTATKEFKKLFKENGFTIKIYLAAGGNQPKH